MNIPIKTFSLTCLCLMFASCDIGYGPYSIGTGYPSPPMPSSKPRSEIGAILDRYPAYRLAEQGRFAEARACVARGDDTQAHYEQGVRYYEYWKTRTRNRTPEGAPAPSNNDVYNDMNQEMIDNNVAELRAQRAAAARGDREAQEWVRTYEGRIQALESSQNVIRRTYH